MKKMYTSPEIMFEDFSLSASIAGNCNVIIDNESYGSCGLRFGFKTYFIDQTTGCTTQIVDGGKTEEYDQLCYHIPNESSDLFNS